MRIDLLQND